MQVRRNQISQIFTPNYLAEFMVKNIKNHYFALPHKKTIDKVKVLEPCAGKGIFLKYLLTEGFSNITAYELDSDLKPYLKNTYPNVNFKFENFLGAKPTNEFDIIVGNPPYLGQNYNAQLFQELVRKYPICEKYFVGNMDLFYFFIHLGIIKLYPGALLSYITTNYWITKSEKTGIKKLKPHIIKDCFLRQYIDLSNLKVFRKATGQHNGIFILQKKTESEIQNKENTGIGIIQLGKSAPIATNKDESYKHIFNRILLKQEIPNTLMYESAVSNNDLSSNNSWNLLVSRQTANVIKKIENYSKVKTKITYLKDYFIIRNGLILIKDEIFILKEGKNIKLEGNDVYIKIQDTFIKLNEKEKERIKRLYKSNAIIPYNYKKDKPSGFLIYFNKNQFRNQEPFVRNTRLQEEYPNLTRYLNQYKEKMERILVNAREDPLDLYFPRRGGLIIQTNKSGKRILTNLEPYYDNSPKVILKYISNINTFGYTTDTYYATSDTYYIWPKNMTKEVDYLFLIAYLNSKLVKFLFKAKNIMIKRSKTKLEENLPLPNLSRFHDIEEKQIINVIKLLTSLILQIQNEEITKINNKDITEIAVPSNLNDKLAKLLTKSQIQTALEELDIDVFQKFIDLLFFQLFHIDEREIDELLKKYYNF